MRLTPFTVLLALLSAAPGAPTATPPAGAPADEPAATPGGDPAAARPRAAIMPLVQPGRVQAVPSAARLDYHGGRVVSNVQVVQVLWGAGRYAPFVESTGLFSLPEFFAAVTDSAYLDPLAQYGTARPGVNGAHGTDQAIGRGTFLRQVRIEPAGAGATITDGDVVAELGRQLRAGALPAPSTDPGGDAQTVYFVYLPAGKAVTVGGETSCTGFCAYHGAFADGGREIYYAVVPDMSAGSGCDLGCGGGAPFENATSVASHELVETITDPEVSLAAGFKAPLAWYDEANGEAGDICNGIARPLALASGRRFIVQAFWSNADTACIAGPGAAPAVAAARAPGPLRAAAALIPAVTEAAAAGAAASAPAPDPAPATVRAEAP